MLTLLLSMLLNKAFHVHALRVPSSQYWLPSPALCLAAGALKLSSSPPTSADCQFCGPSVSQAQCPSVLRSYPNKVACCCRELWQSRVRILT